MSYCNELLLAFFKMRLAQALSAWLSLFGLLSFSKADLLDDILTALENAVDCASCHSLLVPVQTLAHQGDSNFSETFTTICQTLKLADDDVCVGTFNLSGPVLAHSLRQFDPQGDTATKFCFGVFGLCLQPPITPFSVPFPKPAPINPKKFVSKGTPPFQVVHFSDVHVDRQYTVGSDANCTKGICCRNFADHVGPVLEPAGPFGNLHCDTPPDLGDSMLDAINQFGSQAKFSILTGDVVERATWLVDKPTWHREGEVDLAAWNSQMAAKVGSPVYGAIGESMLMSQRLSDTAPVNAFPRADTLTTLNAQWVFNIQSAGWRQWIGAAAATELDHTSGSYAVVVPDTNLRVISVNTQFWYPQNFWLYNTDNMPVDPNGILAFMVRQLQASEDAGQRAWIFGHIPAGESDVFHDQSNYYNQIVQRYKNTIAGQFYGHSHMDQFEIGYSDFNNQTAETADSVALICPALTPSSGNPAFKLYDVDPDTFEIMDAKVFIANLSDPGFQIKPTWELYYSARDSYGPLVGNLRPNDSLDPAFWHGLTEVFETNDTAFQLWNTRLSRGGNVFPCTGECKNNTICEQRALRMCRHLVSLSNAVKRHSYKRVTLTVREAVPLFFWEIWYLRHNWVSMHLPKQTYVVLCQRNLKGRVGRVQAPTDHHIINHP
ncbi:sphingomyelin phosphodiesterase [Ramaria rubella]|nr:sphingomyelin phosphodiesterase [Ramaria rubella]